MATLYGLALGDALGMPSQTLTRDEIRQHYGVIEEFVAPFAGHPVSDGLSAAQVTDDTEQALLLAQRLIATPTRFDPAGWARDLLEWEAGVRARGLLDLLGPSSKATLEAIRQGVDPGEAAKHGTTNGAAMRIAPVGLLVPPSDLSALVDRVEETCRVTHNTGEAIAGAAAVAAYISAKISGAEDALPLALRAAELGQRRGHPAGVDDIPSRIARAVALAESGDFTAEIGTSVATHDSVPAAFGILQLARGDVWQAGLLAANIGDDTDTIGAIACAMCGAGAGMAGLPADRVAQLRAANPLNIEAVTQGLVTLRGTAPQEAAL